MPPSFPTVPVTVDVIIELDSQLIVLIERLNEPYGIAFPGGFVNPGESVADAAVREAKEETGLDVHLTEQFFVYSQPGRDPRGPVASVCFIGMAMGTPVAADDAKRVFAHNVDEALPAGVMAFDHAEILQDYIKFRNEGVRPYPHR
jgi:8-oxo-dGTP diphosphatase